MNPERMMLKGQLANYKMEARNLELEASGLIVSIRMILNPYEEQIHTLPVEECQQQINRLTEIILRLREIHQKIQNLQDQLHG